MKFILFITLAFLLGCTSAPKISEIQLTNNLEKNFDLDNNDNFSPDDQWLCYDTRTEKGGIGGGRTIEMVNVKTGEIKLLYKTDNATDFGPGVGAASFSHVENKVVFIHGLMNCSESQPYAQWRRTGVIIDIHKPNVPIFMDARDVTKPFTPGALRGGTHRHEWSGDGKWIGYTYNDAIMKNFEDRTKKIWNLRTIGVSTKLNPVNVDKDQSGENITGAWYSALVVKVVPNPKPGSDEISRAADDSWIGAKGYQKPDGSWQRARAFLGIVKNSKGENVKDLFVVDIPERIDIPGPEGPLQGTSTSFPMPPKGATQRRLTFTAESKYPGCNGVVRSSNSGDRIAFLAKDENGIEQVFFISPMGSKPEQITTHDSAIQGNVRWHPDGTFICYVQNNSITVCDVRHGEAFRKVRILTSPTEEPPINLVWSHDGKTIAYNRLVENPSSKVKTKQIFVLEFVE